VRDGRTIEHHAWVRVEPTRGRSSNPMATFARSATVNWQGTVIDGKGEIVAGTGAFKLPVTFASRIAESAGKTSPEELIASAHASCYAMALNATLGRKNASAKATTVVATVTADKGEAGIKIVSSKLTVTAVGLEGMDPAQFAEAAREAESRCPVSNALRNNLQIEVEPHVS
jgi:lipoyl-dependent peroxiredoxin